MDSKREIKINSEWGFASAKDFKAAIGISAEKDANRERQLALERYENFILQSDRSAIKAYAKQIASDVSDIAHIQKVFTKNGGNALVPPEGFDSELAVDTAFVNAALDDIKHRVKRFVSVFGASRPAPVDADGNRSRVNARTVNAINSARYFSQSIVDFLSSSAKANPLTSSHADQIALGVAPSTVLTSAIRAFCGTASGKKFTVTKQFSDFLDQLSCVDYEFPDVGPVSDKRALEAADSLATKGIEYVPKPLKVKGTRTHWADSGSRITNRELLVDRFRAAEKLNPTAPKISDDIASAKAGSELPVVIISIIVSYNTFSAAEYAEYASGGDMFGEAVFADADVDQVRTIKNFTLSIKNGQQVAELFARAKTPKGISPAKAAPAGKAPPKLAASSKPAAKPALAKAVRSPVAKKR